MKFDVGLVGIAIVPPAPLTIDHEPVPIVGVFPARAVEFAHTFCGVPATDVDGAASNLTVTVLELEGQEPLLIDHCKTYVDPVVPLKPDTGLEVFVNVPAPPDTIDHVPTPTAGGFAARVADEPHTV